MPYRLRERDFRLDLDFERDRDRERDRECVLLRRSLSLSSSSSQSLSRRSLSRLSLSLLSRQSILGGPPMRRFPPQPIRPSPPPPPPPRQGGGWPRPLINIRHQNLTGEEKRMDKTRGSIAQNFQPFGEMWIPSKKLMSVCVSMSSNFWAEL